MLKVNPPLPNENKIATIKKMPFPLYNREFVSRQIWRRNGRRLEVITHAVDDIVDYGDKMSKVRGRSISLCFVTNLPSIGVVKQCKFEYFQWLDAGGRIPISLINSKIPQSLAISYEARDTFEKRSMMDSAELENLVGRIKLGRETYSEREEEMVSRTVEKFERLRRMGKKWRSIESPDQMVKMDMIQLRWKVKEKQTTEQKYGTGGADNSSESEWQELASEGRGGGDREFFTSNDLGDTTYLRATSVFDATCEELVAREWMYTSREKLAHHYAEGGLGRFSIPTNFHHQNSYAAFDIGIPNFPPREFVTKWIWKKMASNPSTYVITNEDTFHPAFPKNPDYVRGSCTVFWEYRELLPVGNVPQTAVALFMNIDLKGKLPNFLVDSKAKYSLEGVPMARAAVDKSHRIDKEVRKIIMAKLRVNPRGVEDFVSKYQDWETGFATTSVSRTSLQQQRWIQGASHGKIQGAVEGTARTSLKETAAFIWHWLSRAYKHDCKQDVIRSVLKDECKDGVWSQIVNQEVSFDSKVLGNIGRHKHTRSFVSRMTMQMVSDECIFIFLEPCESPDGGERVKRMTSLGHSRSNVTRGFKSVAIKLKKRAADTTLVGLLVNIDVGKTVSSFTVHSLLCYFLEECAIVSRYFLFKLALHKMTESDGGLLGNCFFGGHILGSATVRNQGVEETILACRSLRELKERYKWLPTLLKRIRAGDFAANRPQRKKLVALSELEARVVGNNLMPALKSRKTAAAGVQQWRGQNPSMDELLIEYPWLTSFFVSMAKGVVKSAPWGLLWR